MMSSANRLKRWLTDDQMLLLTVIFVLVVVAIAQSAGRWELAVYALSFWHYLVYALAFLWRQVSHQKFKSDAVLLKTISLLALALVLWETWPNLPSLIVMAAGFSLNVAAAQALGADRTYYGYELAGLPGEKVTSFPYSLTAHPMLIGNMLAFGGTLLDGTFREAWWLLGLLHVVLNLGVILMEAYGGKNRSAGVLCAIVSLTLGSFLLMAGFLDMWLRALATIIAGLVFGGVIIRRYSGRSRQQRADEPPS